MAMPANSGLQTKRAEADGTTNERLLRAFLKPDFLETSVARWRLGIRGMASYRLWLLRHDQPIRAPAEPLISSSRLSTSHIQTTVLTFTVPRLWKPLQYSGNSM